MWLVEFSDGTALSQYDTETGIENYANPDWLPSKVDSEGYVIKNGIRMLYREAYQIPEIYKRADVVRFSWVPFIPELAKKIWHRYGKIVIPKDLPIHSIKLHDGEKLLAHRTPSFLFNLSGGTKIGPIEYILGVKGKSKKIIKEDGSIG